MLPSAKTITLSTLAFVGACGPLPRDFGTMSSFDQDREGAARNADYDQSVWVQDLTYLEEALGRSFANLQDIASTNGLDLARIHADTLAAIEHGENDQDALLALMRLIAVFRDGHLDFQSATQHPAFGAQVAYPIGVVADAVRVVISRQDDPSCPIARGDRVIRINGEAIESLLPEREKLFGYASTDDRRNTAAKSLTSGRLAPKNGLVIEADSVGRLLRCELSPLPPPALQPQPDIPTQPTRDTDALTACLAFGSRQAAEPLPLDFSAQPHWTPLPNDSGISGGTFRAADGRNIGVLRLAFFKATRYLALCQDEWSSFRVALNAPCDQECQQRFVQRLETRLLNAIARQIEEFGRRGVDLLLADVSGNGGGSSYAEAVARLLANNVSWCPAQAHLRGAETSTWLNRRIEEARGDLENPSVPAEGRAAIQGALPVIRTLLAESDDLCDASSLWRGQQPGCRILTSPLSTMCGFAPTTPAADLRGAESATSLVRVAYYNLPDVRYRGPLAVLVDTYSASASELFAALLRGAGARLIGTQTAGAGCGHFNSNTPIILPRSGLPIFTPNCSVYDQNGRNLVFGLEPDIPVAFDVLEDAKARAARVATALQ